VADRSWGVRLERVGSAVVVAPSGELGGDSLDRLREIVRSREPGLELLVLDLTDLVAVEDDGLAFVLNECTRAAELGHGIAIVAGPLAHRAIEASPACADLIVHDDADEVLAPYRHRRSHRARR
jgi:anti-anti-sigma regulatory factor